MGVRVRWLGLLVLLGVLATFAAPVFACGPSAGGSFC